MKPVHSCCQTITTRYHGPANIKGSRISATCEAKRIILSWDHALGVDDNHSAAVEELTKRLGWDDIEFIGGWVPRYGHVWVASC